MSNQEPSRRVGRITISGELISLTEFVSKSDPIEGIDFVDCQIVGPAVLTPFGCSFIDSAWQGAAGSFAVEVISGTPVLAGSIIVSDCTFTRSVFRRVSVAGSKDIVEQLNALPERSV